MKYLAMIFCVTFVFSPLHAEIKSYQSTDNTGINKLERIEVIEKYLADLSGTLKSMEVKLDQSATKLSTLEQVVKAMKEVDIKNIQERIGEKKSSTPDAEPSELDKIKADIQTIKNDDIEKLQVDVRVLNATLKTVESILKVNKLK